MMKFTKIEQMAQRKFLTTKLFLGSLRASRAIKKQKIGATMQFPVGLENTPFKRHAIEKELGKYFQQLHF